MGNRDVKISFIIAIYNMEAYITQCLDSIVSQTVGDYEVICVDDCSTDSSVDIVHKYIDSYPNFKLIESKKNEGAACARNIGLNYANGEYIFFLDADDWIREDALEILTNTVNATSPDMIFYNYQNVFMGEIDHWHNISLDKYENQEYSGEELFNCLVEDKQFNIALCIRLYRRSFLEKNKLRFVKGVITEDTIFVFQCMMLAKKVQCTNEKLYYYRRRSDSISGSATKQRASSYFYSILEVLSFWKMNTFSERTNDAISLFLQERYNTFLVMKRKAGLCDSIDYGHRADKLMYRIYIENGIKKKEFLHLKYEDMEYIRKASACYIYGAGNYGKELFDKLYDANIDVEAFLVSSSDLNNCNMCRDRMVYSLDTYEIIDDGLIVIAASKEHRQEMVKTLESLNYKNYYIVD